MFAVPSTFCYLPYCRHIVDDPRTELKKVSTNLLNSLSALYDTVVFNIGLRYSSLPQAPVEDYEKATKTLVDFASTQPRAFLVETGMIGRGAKEATSWNEMATMKAARGFSKS